MNDKIDDLIKILMNDNARIDERDDVALYLADSDDARALSALVKIGSDKSVDGMILRTSGEANGQIWVRQNHFDLKHFNSVSEETKLGIEYVISNRKFEWIQKYSLRNFIDSR